MPPSPSPEIKDGSSSSQPKNGANQPKEKQNERNEKVMSEGSPIVFDHEQPLPPHSISTSPIALATSMPTFLDSCSDTSNTPSYPSSAGRSSAYPKLTGSMQQVQQTWRVRREERDQRNSAVRGGKPMSVQPKQLRRPPSFPSLCALVQKTWTQAFESKTEQKRNSGENRPSVFPSMLSIIQSHSLVTQVRDLQEGPSTASDPDMQSVLSILPAGYDWNTAILQMAQSRSRAFLLLDLATIVRRTVLWKRTHPNITWVYSVSSNANGKLLQLLLMAGVRLVTSTRSDVIHSLAALSKLKRSPKHQCIADSTTHIAPPDSYIRQLLRANISSFAVDGAPEVHRLVQIVQHMQARHVQDSCSLEFVLRFQSDPPGWMKAVESTENALRQYPEHRLSGISLDIGNHESWKERQDQAQTVIEHILRDHDSININLTGVDQEAFPDEWVQWCTCLQSENARVAEVAVECSYPLVASAGALCTRIIGVRDQSSDDGHLKQSLYIDDGCYGSLYQTKGDLKPIPLGNGQYDSKADASYSSTVWGPTCDGLDRVCRDIPLPKLERDDWLVFPNLGCPGALGTAFNGFEPPDTAYCVLGYFKQ